MKFNSNLILIYFIIIYLVSFSNCNKFLISQSEKNNVKINTIQKLHSKKLIKEGWLRISSSNLKDIRRYPAIQHQNKLVTIQILGDNPNDKQYTNVSQFDNGYFRKNSQWKPNDTQIPAIDAFYFRLNGQNFYYTETPTDMIVMGAIAVNNVINSKPGEAPGCFSVIDQESDSWQVCTLNGGSPESWVCAIKEVLGLKCDKGGQIILEKKVIVKQPIILIPLPSPDCSKDFNYNVHGKNWICRCNEGLEQSPIDLPTPTNCLKQIKINAQFEYPLVKKENLLLVYDRNMLRIIPKQENVNMGQLTDLDGTIYEVSEIQFHTPAEHTIGGQKFDLEVQVIHKAIKGEFKQKAVLSMLYKKTPGARMQFFEEFDILNLPNLVNTEETEFLHSDFSVMKMMYDEDQYNAPPPFNYYKYRGSYTSPPCEEDVIWFVASDVIPLGYTVIEFIRDVLNPPPARTPAEKIAQASTFPDNFDGNNREIQLLRSREIFFYDRTKGCIPYEVKAKDLKITGHYEKVEKKVYKYFYVDSDKPSGVPKSFVVSEQEATGEGKLTLNQMRKTDRYNIHQ